MTNLQRAIIAELEAHTVSSFTKAMIEKELTSNKLEEGAVFALQAFALPHTIDKVEDLVRAYYILFPIRDTKRPCTIATPHMPSFMYDDNEGLTKKYMKKNGNY